MVVPSSASPALADTAEIDAEAPGTVASTTEAPSQDANAAESSVADTEGAKQPTSLLDVVRSVVEKPVAAEGSPAPEGSQAAETAAPEGDKPEGEAGAEDDVPFHQHPRWKAVIAERDGFKDRAEQYDRITGFMEQSNLQPKEVAEGFEVMALLKANTPETLEAALAYWEPRYQWLLQQTGRALPDDLRQRVDDGLVDEETAQELARAQARERLHTTNNEQRQQREQSDQQAATTREAATSGAVAVQEWETQTLASDPDYPKMQPFVEARAVALAHGLGRPVNGKEEAVQIVSQAYREVKAQLKSAMPKRQPITPSPSGSSTSATTTKPPSSLREAIDRALPG